MKKYILLAFLLFSVFSKAQVLGNKILISQSVGPDRPTYIQHTSNFVDSSNPTITLTKPTVETIENDDLLIILVGNDYGGTLTQWNNTTNKPTGFTFVSTGGDTSSDCHFGVFYKIADGTEASTVDVTSVGTVHDGTIGFYIHIKGANATTPIGNLGAIGKSASGTTIDLVGVTGNADDLGMYILSCDGGDKYPFSVTSSPGWALTDEVQSATGGVGSSGTFGMKIYASTSAENVRVNSAVSDGNVGIQFRIIK